MSDKPFSFPLGLPSQKDGSLPETVEQMRAAIYRGARDSAFIANRLLAADRSGWDGEDRFTYLAYEALLRLEELWRREVERNMRDAGVPLVPLKPGETL
jgi:hypothetical protein